ncbi:MAG TPA: ABC transporter substrate-binding protein, partial [Candidatus Nanoarchaeia archaeon]|nr:ABC transporter substrate-binding protein [Candidatus Nanoarchaeia archaeon]
IATGLMFVANLNSQFLVAVPDRGGEITEGVVGIPRFVNPVLAVSDADKDLVSLVFSGLLKATPDGKLVPDLASEFSISPDGRTYTFTLRDDIVFHDNTPITTDDVEFTIEKIQDSTIKSPKRPIWDGVIVQKVDEKTITFSLKQPYAPFIDNFTIGIIPKHIWNDVPTDQFSFSELNINAVGNGPYYIKKVRRNSYGLSNFYTLQSFRSHALGEPFVKYINLSFYQNNEELITAFKNGDIDTLSGISPAELQTLDTSNSVVVTAALPRVFGVFFNQNQESAFLNKEVRVALDTAIDKDAIIADVLKGYADKIDSPVPFSKAAEPATTTSQKSRTDQAISILTKAGWTINSQTGVMEKKVGTNTVALTFSLATSDAPELKQIAEEIKEDWEEIGVSVDVRVFEIGDLNQNVIRPRKFEALLFGEVVGREFDLYPFWHSSQRNDPGLNIALYANISADKILEEIRSTQDQDTRRAKVDEFEALFKADMPASFIYSPHFIYLVPKKLMNVSLGQLIGPSERFNNVQEWYIETNKVWKIFAY